MDNFIGALIDQWNKYWTELLVSAGIFCIGWVIGMWRARRRWAKKEFFDRLNVSLNILNGGKLQIRTLLEKNCDAVFLNAAITKAVIKAAKNTTPKDSILPLPLDDYWHYLNPVLNEISEHFASGYLRRDAGLPVNSEIYLLCLTCEAAGGMRQRKVRAMLMRKSVLTNLPAEKPELESSSHETRWTTLNQIAAEYKKEPERFLEMEICF